MKLVADEGVDRCLVKQLRQNGHDVTYIAETNSGATDSQIIELSNAGQAVLVTCTRISGRISGS